MSEQLFIRLMPETDQAQWRSGRSQALPAHVDQVQTGSIEQAIEAAQAVKQQPVVLIVPASDIVLSQINLPIRQHSKLLKATPFALEEQLAEDVDKLHFAIGERQANGDVPVASVARETLELWLQPWREQGIEVVAVLPEMLCLPPVQADSGWQVLIEGRACVVRNGRFSGFCCDTSELGTFMSMALSDNEMPEGLRVRLYTVSGSTVPALDGLPVATETIAIKAGLACLMAGNSAANINLLQGGFASEPVFDRWWRPVRATAMLFVLWVFISTAYAGLQYWRVASQLETLQTENMNRFQQLFPEVTRIVDMRAQGEQRLRALRQDGGDAGLFALLGATAGAVHAVPGLRIQEIQLRDSQLFLSLTANNIQSLEALRGHFAQQANWQLDVQSANAGSDGVQIRANLRAA